jgi:hypothetical protein
MNGGRLKKWGRLGLLGACLLGTACGEVGSATDLDVTDISSAFDAESLVGTLPPSDQVLPPTGSSPATVPGSATTVVGPDGAEVPTTTTVVVPPSVDPNNAASQARPIPSAGPAEAPPAPPVGPPWASSTRTTAEGYVVTDIGCAASKTASGIDAFFADRAGPLVGSDYQHVYPLGNDRFLWLFQDSFVDHSGGAVKLNQASFVHNSAMIQTGNCFQMFHRGTTSKPGSFEDGAGEKALERWFWPMGGEMNGRRLQVFWVEMQKDGYDPSPPDGLGWHPARTWIATYDPKTLARLSFDPAPNDDVRPIYGYAVSSDASWTYLFGNTFEQNMVREGGFWAGPHSATSMWLARVPRGSLNSVPEYWSTSGWSTNRAAAEPFLSRHWAENPMQPRYIDGQWVAVAKVDGYWGEEMTVDVAPEPWGPWSTVDRRRISPRTGDAKMNTYHAYLLPWRENNGSWIVSISNNARNMVRDAFPNPWRYRVGALSAAWVPTPLPPPPPETTVPETVAPVITEPPTTTTVAPTTVAPATVPPTVPPTVAPTTSTTAAPTTSTTLAPTTTTTAVPTPTAAAPTTVPSLPTTPTPPSL